MTFEVNPKFITRLTIAILSSPIVYIPHFNYAYIDRALACICEQGVADVNKENIAELNEKGELFDFDTKVKDEDHDKALEGWLDVIVSNNPEENEILATKKIWLVKNFFQKFGEPTVIQRLQAFATKYERKEYEDLFTIILVSPHSMEELPSDIEKMVTVVELPRPDDKEIGGYLKQVLPVSAQFAKRETELRNALMRTLQGLQQYEVEQIIRATAVRTGGFLTEMTIRYALDEKKSIVKKSGIIEVIDSDDTFEKVGGLENLREDLTRKGKIFRHLDELPKTKLPLPKGILVMGMPGCGKSLIAKSIANEFGVSLLRLDVNRLMGQYVGQSEQNLRKALATAEAAHPCVLWIDEIEKAFAGANNGGGGNDIVMRLMGHFLTWMQERKTAVYIVATANDVMRPEFMRKGRFDEVYFVDFPNVEERKKILKIKVDAYRETEDQRSIFNLTDINDEALGSIAAKMRGSDGKEKADENDGFAGAEIQSVVETVMEKKYIEYLENAEKGRLKGEKVASVKVTEADFDTEIQLIRPSVMCNQKGKKDEQTGKTEKTSVERIRDLQSVYKFRTASKELSNKK